LSIELWQIAILRKVLNDFCSQHDLSLGDPTAVMAARELMRFAAEGETDPMTLMSRLADTMGDHLPRQRSPRRTYGDIEGRVPSHR
jgi:hypothetical protein